MWYKHYLKNEKKILGELQVSTPSEIQYLIGKRVSRLRLTDMTGVEKSRFKFRH